MSRKKLNPEKSKTSKAGKAKKTKSVEEIPRKRGRPPGISSKRLTKKQQAFVAVLPTSKTLTEAAEKAGYADASKKGSANLDKPIIIKAIAEDRYHIANKAAAAAKRNITRAENMADDAGIDPEARIKAIEANNKLYLKVSEHILNAQAAIAGGDKGPINITVRFARDQAELDAIRAEQEKKTIDITGDDE